MTVIRPYHSGDEEGILQLFPLVFQSEMPLAVWQWKYLRGDQRPPVFVAEEDGHIVCHFAAIRQRAVWEGQTALIWDSVDTMCHPRYQGKGLFRRAIQAFMRELGEKPSLFIYGFPTERHKRLGELLVGYEPVARVSQVQKILSSSLTQRSSAGVVFDVLPLNWDVHWQQLEKQFTLTTCRDHAYLMWRYLTRPDRRYRIVTIPAAPALAVIGMQGGKALLMELLLERSDGDLTATLLAGIETVAREEGAESIEGWFPPFSWEHRLLCTTGNYTAQETEHWLECRLFDQRLSARGLAESFYYSLGDFDVY